MSSEIAWKQNILVTDFHLLKSLLSLDLVRRHSSVDSADKTFAVKTMISAITPRLLTLVSGHQGTIRIRPKRLDSLNTQCSMAVTGVRKKNLIH